MKFSHLLRLSLVTSVIFTGFSAFAEDEANLLIFDSKEVVQGQQAPEVMSETPEEIQVKFDPSEVTEADKEFNRERFIEKARAEMNKEIPKDVLYDFETPRTEAELDKLLQLSDTDIASFLGKK